MKRTVKSLLLANLLFTVTPALPLIQSDAQAALTVIDISNLKQNTLTAVRTAEQIQNQIEQIRNQVRSLQTELSEASKIAMKAQSVVERSQAYNNQVAAILNSSAAADGEVRQLQSTNQMLGIMSGQLDGLTQTLAVSARVSAMAAAQAANREEAERAFNGPSRPRCGAVMAAWTSRPTRNTPTCQT